MNRTIPAPKPAGIFWPVMLGHMVPGELHPIRLLKTVNYPDGSSTLEHRKYVAAQHEKALLAAEEEKRSLIKQQMKQRRLLDMDHPDKKMDPIMSQLIHALSAQKSGVQKKRRRSVVGPSRRGSIIGMDFNRLQEDLSWRGGTNNSVQ